MPATISEISSTKNVPKIIHQMKKKTPMAEMIRDIRRVSFDYTGTVYVLCGTRMGASSVLVMEGVEARDCVQEALPPMIVGGKVFSLQRRYHSGWYMSYGDTPYYINCSSPEEFMQNLKYYEQFYHFDLGPGVKGRMEVVELIARYNWDEPTGAFENWMECEKGTRSVMIPIVSEYGTEFALECNRCNSITIDLKYGDLFVTRNA